MAIDEDAVPETVDFEVGTAPVLDEAHRRRRHHQGGVRVGRHARGGGRGPWLVLLSASGATVAVLTVAAVAIVGGAGRPGLLGEMGVPGRLSASVPGTSRLGSPLSDTPLPGSPLPGATGSPVVGQSTGSTGSTGSGRVPLPPAESAQSDNPEPSRPARPAAPGVPTVPADPPWPPPVMAATGRIINVAGLCLSGIGVDNRVRLGNCDGSTGQEWTLATDGTLRAFGQCLQPSDGLVWLRNCDAGAAQQWRAGPAMSVVNFASADCLGDPRAGMSTDIPQRTAPCDQSDPQRWTLPQAG